MPTAGIKKQPHHQILRNEEILTLVETMADLGIKKVRLTGGEPLVRKGLIDLISQLHEIKGIEEVTLTTNGLMLEEHAEFLFNAGIKRMNLSLDSLNSETYYRLTRGGDLKKALRGIDKAFKLGFAPLKINVVLIKGENDEEVDQFLDYFHPSIEVRFIELMPIGEAASWSKEKFVDLTQLFSRRHDLIPDLEKHVQGPCSYFKHLKTGRRVGIIHSLSNHFCDQCNRLRITSDGILKTCLHNELEFPLKAILKDSVQLKETILKAIQLKPEKHLLNQEDASPIRRNMYTIGG